MTDQTLDSGQPVARRFSRLSSPRRDLPSNPANLFGILSGFPASGKTNFMMTCPGAFIINCDRKELPDKAPSAAAVWPTKDEHGSTIDVDGRPFLMEWPHVEAKFQVLKDLADQKSDRPAVVVIDTIAGALDLVRSHMMKLASVTTWEGLGDGRRSWDTAFDKLVTPLVELQSAGYGIYVLCHLANRVIKTGDTERSVIETTISNGLWKRLSWRADLSAAIVRELKPTTRQITENVGGRTRNRSITENLLIHTLTVDRPELIAANIVRSPTRLPEVELNETTGWDSFTTAYSQSVTPQES